jgi:hypothetical protein
MEEASRLSLRSGRELLKRRGGYLEPLDEPTRRRLARLELPPVDGAEQPAQSGGDFGRVRRGVLRARLRHR